MHSFELTEQTKKLRLIQNNFGIKRIHESGNSGVDKIARSYLTNTTSTPVTQKWKANA